jgi:hypothetical protein
MQRGVLAIGVNGKVWEPEDRAARLDRSALFGTDVFALGVRVPVVLNRSKL